MAEGLNKRQQLFVEHYIATWNATESAKRAGYSDKTAYAIGHRLLKTVEIKAAIDDHVTQIMPKGEVVQRLAAMARNDLADFTETTLEKVTTRRETIKFMGGITQEEDTAERMVTRLDLKKAADNNKLGMVRKYKLKADGSVEIELHDAQSALDKLAKMHGLYIDKPDPITPDGQQPYDQQALTTLQQKLLAQPAIGATPEDSQQSNDG